MDTTDLSVFNAKTPDTSHANALDHSSRSESDLLLVGLTHDMRSPLFAVLGYLQLLERQLEKSGSDSSKQYVLLAKQAGLRLDQMLTEALDSARFGHPLPSIDLREVRLRDLFERLWGTFQIIASQKQIHLNMILKGNEDIVVRADPSFLERALDNLVANAIKFSPAGHEVVLTSFQKEGCVYFEVTDRGRGISKEEQPAIFEPFHQAQSGDQTGGFGLGLAIVRFIAKAHGGGIHVQSELGAGTCFTLWIPASAS